jgi:hypothetical protein
MRFLVVATILWLALGVYLADPAAAGKSSGADSRLTLEGLGFGQTREEAADDARENAIYRFINNQRPPLLWADAEKYIRNHTTNPNTIVKEQDPMAEQHWKATVTMELPANDYRELIEKDRATRATERHGLIFPGFVVLVALLGAAGIYYRVRSKSKQ